MPESRYAEASPRRHLASVLPEQGTQAAARIVRGTPVNRRANVGPAVGVILRMRLPVMDGILGHIEAAYQLLLEIQGELRSLSVLNGTPQVTAMLAEVDSWVEEVGRARVELADLA